MEIRNEMHVGAPIDEAWKLLTDIPAIAPCLPGAELTGKNGDDFEGRMKVKVGPITAEYQGTARITELNETDHRVLLTANGRDSRGAGNASAEIVAEMELDGEGTRVTIVTDLKVSGKVAQFGRGVMADISKKLLGQFAECIEHKLATPTSHVDAAEPASDEPVELLEVAGRAVAKRVVPVALAVVIVLLLFRRRRRRYSARSAVSGDAAPTA
jgi:carbon monoxide dehydrogenase subunit G